MTAPKPGPRPTPGSMPGAVHRAPVTPDVSATDPAGFGRVDADNVVWVRTADGERRVGEWQAGTPEEGLAHYARRFDDLAADVRLLVARLDTHPAEAARIGRDAAALRESLSTAAVVGDLADLDRRLAALMEQAGVAAAQEQERATSRKVAAGARKEELIAEIEALGTSAATDWKSAGDRLQASFDEWKALPRTSKAADDALWERFRTARAGFQDRRTAHFDDLDRQRDRVRRVKEDLVSRAEALQNSTDWAETARAYRDLMTEWKAAGRAHRAVDDRLWAQFRAAQDRFFDAKSADNDRRDVEFEENAQAKQALLDDYDARIDPATDLDRARDLLRELEEKWDEIGYVPRGRVAEFDSKLGALEARVTDFADAQWRTTDPEIQARVDQFRAKVDDLTAAAEAAEKKGNSAKAADLRAQAAQWSEWADAAAGAVGD
ncbi:DUF349 domain-containing protein [Corynebacterium terpenotabidum]|uniref:DNA repair ATPase n=1 Tax=Corynebacterium terpenotabidum Y-11 TaxID=1200352 RepID=S4XK54_9CORY|nr:DUF349 domain-containing protein [Corynebacterium terpenotabidum]AGP30933.1 hypothetical protein A606_06430 [Corynebacterium terpenotabidum Y-11]